MKQLPSNLKRNGSFAGACGQCQQDAITPVCNGFEHAPDGNFLVITAVPRAASVFERHGREAVSPGVALNKGFGPQLVGCGVTSDIALLARGHVHAVNGLTVGGVGEAHRQLFSVLLGLCQTFGVRFAPGLGLDHCELGVAVNQHVVSNLGLGALALALQAARGNDFPADAAAIHHAPPSRLEGRVDVFSASFGFVHELACLGTVKTRSRNCQVQIGS